MHNFIAEYGVIMEALQRIFACDSKFLKFNSMKHVFPKSPSCPSHIVIESDHAPSLGTFYPYSFGFLLLYGSV